MSIRDFESVKVVLPMNFTGPGTTTQVGAVVEVARDEQVVITIPGGKHANHFLEMILTQQLVGFTTIQNTEFPRVPEKDQEALFDGGKEVEPPVGSFVCEDHKPVQHRDGAEPWCNKCQTNANFKVSESKIKLAWIGGKRVDEDVMDPKANPGLRIGDSIRKSFER